jgi:signal transduction histidine kinase
LDIIFNVKLYAIGGLANAIISIAVAFFVFIQNLKSKVHQIFFLFGIAVAGWSLSYFFWLSANDYSSALYWCQSLTIFATWIPATFLHFILVLVGKDKRNINVLVLYYLFSALLCLLTFTPYMIADLRHRINFPYWPTAGGAYLIFCCYYSIGVIYALVVLYRHLVKANAIERRQLKFLFIGTLIGFLGGATNFPLWFDVAIPPVGTYFIPCYMFLIAYAIVKHRFMDIRIAVASTAIFFIVYAVALGIPFYLYHNTHHFAALVMAVFLASVAPFIYARLRKEAKELILKGQLDHQQALTRVVQEQLIESEKMAAVGYLVGGLAHQLRNRFASVVFFADFASRKVAANRGKVLEDKDCDEALAHIKKITETVYSTRDVIDGVLNYAADRETKESINIKKLVSASIELIDFKIEPGSVTFENAIGDDVPPVSGNFAQLQEVVFNIIDNAYYAMMEKKTAGVQPGYKPRMDFSAKVQDGMVDITIVDNGMGIKDEDRRKLFTPLFSTKKKGRKGHGLGLFVMKQIVERNHGGRINLTSTYGQGVRVEIQLPVAG